MTINYHRKLLMMQRVRIYNRCRYIIYLRKLKRTISGFSSYCLYSKSDFFLCDSVGDGIVRSGESSLEDCDEPIETLWFHSTTMPPEINANAPGCPPNQLKKTKLNKTHKIKKGKVFLVISHTAYNLVILSFR